MKKRSTCRLSQDSAFSDDGSSIGGGSEYGPPDLRELGFFGQPCCRVSTQVTITAGAKQAGVCGRPVSNCKHHSGHRLQGRYRHQVGWYYKTMSALKGFQGHRKVGTTLYSQEQVDTIRRDKRQEMMNLVGGMTTDEEGADQTDEMESLTREVHFGGTSTLGPRPARAARLPGSPGEMLTSESLHASSHQPPDPGPRPPSILYGLTDETGDRLVLGNHDQVKEFVASKRFRLASLFGTLPEAQAWMTQERPDLAYNPEKIPKQTTPRSKETIVIPDSDSYSNGSEAPPLPEVSHLPQKGEPPGRNAERQDKR
jgi:hypothetical protein